MQRKNSDSNTNKQERETAVSQRLLTFVLQYVQANNLGAKVHNFYLTPTRNEEKHALHAKTQQGQGCRGIG